MKKALFLGFVIMLCSFYIAAMESEREILEFNMACSTLVFMKQIRRFENLEKQKAKLLRATQEIKKILHERKRARKQSEVS